jgi:MYXO-CTERM domain-containing protein
MQIRSSVIASTAVLFLASAVVSWGGTIAINNPSFESPSCQGTAPVTCAVNGWAAVGAAGAELPTGVFAPPYSQTAAFDGSQYAFVNGGASLTQDLATSLLAGTEYELTVWVLNRGCGGCVFDPTAELLVGGVDVGAATGTTPALGTWGEWTLDYVSPGSGPLVGGDLSIQLSAAANQGDFDLVGLSSNATASGVPEPSTFLFAGAGLLGLGLAARRRRLAR